MSTLLFLVEFFIQMVSNIKNNPQARVSLSKNRYKLPPLDLLEVQKESYNEFKEKDITNLLAEISPIEDYSGKNWNLAFTDHNFDKPKM